jgi:hypothetical protein
MAIKQTRAWFLSKFYADPLHPHGLLPVCRAYGSAFGHHRFEDSDWGLVLMYTSPPQIEASRQDERVVFCGTDYSKPPAQVLECYAALLDPTETYQSMGQLLAKLAETEPLFMHE